jgi:hypothetical protein
MQGHFFMCSGGGSSGGGQIPKFDPNKVNQIQASFLDPSKLKLGSGGGGSSGFNPDQFNSITVYIGDGRDILVFYLFKKKNVILLYWRELLMHLIIYRLGRQTYV